jgi:AraC-like DNA-binding protein
VDGERSHFTTFGFETWIGHPPPMERPHRHHEVELNFLWQGEATYLTGGRLLQLPTQRLCLFWGAVPHHIVQRDASCKLSWLTLPLVWVLRWGLPSEFIEHLLSGNWVIDAVGSSPDAAMFLQWHDDRARQSTAWEQAALLEVEARVRRAALAEQRGDVSCFIQGAEGAIAVVESVARYVAEHFDQPLRIKDIGVALCRHPNYLMQLFKQHCGVTILEYLLQMRLSNAQRLLTTTDRKIADIAADSGFSSLNRFYQAFHRATGLPPGEYRKCYRVKALKNESND